MTTFGVGELSALNGIAGAYAEQVPLVHIVGSPSTTSERNGLLLHHTLGNGDFNVFKNMSAQISCYVAKLNKPNEIADEIDHAIRECWVRSRPVYIMLPSDMTTEKVEGARLGTPLGLSELANEPGKEDYVVDIILKDLYAAKNPIVLVDACAIRHRCLVEVNTFLGKTNLPVFVAPMGKGAVDEQKPNYGGVYAGNGSQHNVAKAIDDADLVLCIGTLKVKPIIIYSTFFSKYLVANRGCRATSTQAASPIASPNSTQSTCTARTAPCATPSIQELPCEGSSVS